MARLATVGQPTRVKRAAAWKQCDLSDRFADCLRMLHIHGYLSYAEFDRKLKRLRKDVAAGKYAEKPA